MVQRFLMINVELLAPFFRRRIEFAMEGRAGRYSQIAVSVLITDNTGIPQKLGNTSVPASGIYPGSPYTGPYGVNSDPYSDYPFPVANSATELEYKS